VQAKANPYLGRLVPDL